MGDETAADGGWFEGLDRGDLEAARRSIERGSAATPADWPGRAIEVGFATDADDYYDALHEATLYATREAGRERERAGDQQVTHAVRAMDDRGRII